MTQRVKKNKMVTSTRTEIPGFSPNLNHSFKFLSNHGSILWLMITADVYRAFFCVPGASQVFMILILFEQLLAPS